MANDTLDPDSALDAELPGDTEIVDGAATPDGTTAGSTNGDEGKDKGGKVKALSDTEAALKERQAEYTRVSQQIAEMRGQLSMLAQMQASKQPTEVEKDLLDSITDDELIENPSKAKELMRGFRKEIAKVLQERDEYWRGEVNKVSGNRVDPDTAAAMNELRNDPELAGLPDSALKAMAGRLLKATGKKVAVRTPPGNVIPSRNGSSSARPSDGELTDEQKMFLQISGVDRGGMRTDTLE